MAATHSGWCQSVALCRSCWNVQSWSVVESPGLKLAWSAKVFDAVTKEARDEAAALAASQTTISADETAADAPKVTGTECTGKDNVLANWVS